MNSRHFTSLFFFLFLVWLTPGACLAELVSSDFSAADNSTLYVCRLSDNESIEIYRRQQRGSDAWQLSDFDVELLTSLAQKKRWKQRYDLWALHYGATHPRTIKAKKRLARFRQLVRSLKECESSSNLSVSSVACTQFADITSNELASGSLTRRSGTVTPRIINGVPCRRGDTSVVELEIELRFTNGTCTGTVLDDYTVLTAAHCVEGAPRSITVVSGNGSVKSSFYVSHPRYNRFALAGIENFDVAIIKTLLPIPTGSSQIISGSVSVGEAGIIAGFGLDENDRYGRLRVAEVTVTYTDWDTIATSYDGTVNKSNTCFGDSGGPLFVEENGKLVVAGVTSNGDLFDCGLGDISRYANLTNPEVRSFVESHL
ncbi:MAG: trypsin-like serine protease [Bdellovibrionales bacterium]|nr:trypsin-like serine protease [Bdellovibrionales bacterium]